MLNKLLLQKIVTLSKIDKINLTYHLELSNHESLKNWVARNHIPESKILECLQWFEEYDRKQIFKKAC